jgi:hypothetical protein
MPGWSSGFVGTGGFFSSQSVSWRKYLAECIVQQPGKVYNPCSLYEGKFSASGRKGGFDECFID